MINLKTLFIRWFFNEFCANDELHTQMATISEDSPWHRERTVAVHTNMVVAEYIGNAPDVWAIDILFGAFACAFHDVGKPQARTEAYKPERGVYYRYGGHELISARLWEDWAVRNWRFLVDEFEFEPYMIYHIGWLIENHLPWSIKNSKKRQTLAIGVNGTVGIPTFINVLKADTWGRISDDDVKKKSDVTVWCEEFVEFATDAEFRYGKPYIDDHAPVLYMIIAASGSGKTTLVNSGFLGDANNPPSVFSMDLLRHEWYDMDDYSKAYDMSCDDATFLSRVGKYFKELVDTRVDIIADNVNISKKRRAYFINTARDNGYTIKAVVLPVTLQAILYRQSTRDDKDVPHAAVQQMYMSLHAPSYGEFDSIVVYDGNLP